MKIDRNKIISIGGDFVINILASVIYTFAKQIVVFPVLAARLSDGDYGELLTVIGVVNVCTSLVGVTLNNIRLVQNNRYVELGENGDFNIFNAIGSGLSVALSLILWRMFGYSQVTALLLTLYMLVSNLYQYAVAFFRLELDFKRILVVNIIASIAYVVAVPLFATKLLWPMVFLLGEGAGLIYVSVQTKFYREPFRTTPLFKETSGKIIALMLASVLANVLTYADRMIIYPIIGSESVSYYSVASFFGKSAGIVMTPISGVLLGYFSQRNFKASKKLFAVVNGVSLLCLALFLGGCWLFAPWFTKLLYPTLYAHAEQYIFAANLGAVISIAGNMAQPMILKCCTTKLVLAIQIVYGIAYLITSLWLMPLFGLWGFCWATIIANTVRLLALYLVGYIKF